MHIILSCLEYWCMLQIYKFSKNHFYVKLHNVLAEWLGWLSCWPLIISILGACVRRTNKTNWNPEHTNYCLHCSGIAKGMIKYQVSSYNLSFIKFVCLFISRVGLNLCLTNWIHICTLPDTIEIVCAHVLQGRKPHPYPGGVLGGLAKKYLLIS